MKAGCITINVNDPKIKKWLGEVVGREGEDLSRHDKWLCMMYPRLKLLQRLLAEDGFIFVSIDVLNMQISNVSWMKYLGLQILEIVFLCVEVSKMFRPSLKLCRRYH